MLTSLAIVLILLFIAAISCTDSVEDPDETLIFKYPCTVDEDKIMEDMLPQKLAERLSDQAYNAMVTMEHFRDEYAHSLQSQADFDALLKSLEGKEWLRDFIWYQDEVFPKEKQVGVPMPRSSLEMLHNRSDELLPKMYKALTMILGSFVELKDHGLDKYDGDIAQKMTKHFDDTITSVKSILCTFNTIMHNSDVDFIPSLTQGEIPKITEQNSGLLYRDALNYLEYLSQVFQFIGEDIFQLLCEVKTSLGIPCTPDWYGPECNLDGELDPYFVYPYNMTINPWNETIPD